MIKTNNNFILSSHQFKGIITCKNMASLSSAELGAISPHGMISASKKSITSWLVHSLIAIGQCPTLGYRYSLVHVVLYIVFFVSFCAVQGFALYMEGIQNLSSDKIVKTVVTRGSSSVIILLGPLTNGFIISKMPELRQERNLPGPYRKMEFWLLIVNVLASKIYEIYGNIGFFKNNVWYLLAYLVKNILGFIGEYSGILIICTVTSIFKKHWKNAFNDYEAYLGKIEQSRFLFTSYRKLKDSLSLPLVIALSLHTFRAVMATFRIISFIKTERFMILPAMMSIAVQEYQTIILLVHVSSDCYYTLLESINCLW